MNSTHACSNLGRTNNRAVCTKSTTFDISRKFSKKVPHWRFRSVRRNISAASNTSYTFSVFTYNQDQSMTKNISISRNIQLNIEVMKTKKLLFLYYLLPITVNMRHNDCKYIWIHMVDWYGSPRSLCIP